MKKSAVIIAFSSRIGGNCEKTANIMEQILEKVYHPVRFNFSEFEIQPCGRCGYECLRQRVCPWDGDTERKILDAICSFIVINGTENGNYRNAMMQHTDGEPKLLYLRAKDFGKSSIAGDLMESAEAAAAVEGFAAALAGNSRNPG